MSARPDPFALLAEALARAEAADPKDWNAMCLATVGADGRPSARIVLLKGVDESGLVFYTNLGSRKSRELLSHPLAAATFYWGSINEQVRVEGRIEQVTAAESDAYFASRPRGSQIGAWASRQSEALDERATLEARVAETEKRFADGPVPRPPFWGGWRLVPDRFEFWKAHPSRLHDRTVFVRGAAGWETGKLYP